MLRLSACFVHRVWPIFLLTLFYLTGPSLTDVSSLTSTFVPAFRTRLPSWGEGFLAHNIIPAARPLQGFLACSGKQERLCFILTQYISCIHLAEFYPLSKAQKAQSVTSFLSALFFYQGPGFTKRSPHLHLCKNNSWRHRPLQHAEGPGLWSKKDLDWNLGSSQWITVWPWFSTSLILRSLLVKWSC